MTRLNINQLGSVNQSVGIKSCVYLKCIFISSTDTSVLSCKRLCEQVHHFIWFLSIWMEHSPIVPNYVNLKIFVCSKRLFSFSSFYLVIRARSSTAAHQSTASGRGGECVSSSALSLSAMATEGFLRPITGPLWLSLYTKEPKHSAQRCRAAHWCKCHRAHPPRSSHL